MDYGFVPCGTRGDLLLRTYLEWRSGSTVVDTPDPTLQSFVDALSTSGSVQRPVNDLAISCHGSGYGILELQLDASSPAQAYFDGVQQVEARGTIKIPSAVLDPRPFPGVAAFFRIVGCEIGQARPYLERLKAALGGQVFIIASPHIQALRQWGFALGLLRYLRYAFYVRSAEAFQSRLELVEAFHLQQLEWYDRTPIPRSFWELMVHTDIAAFGERGFDVGFNFRPYIGTIKGEFADGSASWSHFPEKVGPFKVSLLADPPPLWASAVVRRSFVRQAINSKPEFAPGHPFPLHRQRGYASFDAFIDGHDWWPEPSSNQLWAGHRHVYEIEVPIGKPPVVLTGPRVSDLAIEPFYDFVTPTGTGNRLGLSETDPLLFTIV